MRIYKYFFQFIYSLLLILLIILLLLLALLLLLLLLLLHARIKNEGDFMSQDEIPKKSSLNHSRTKFKKMAVITFNLKKCYNVNYYLFVVIKFNWVKI